MTILSPWVIYLLTVLAGGLYALGFPAKWHDGIFLAPTIAITIFISALDTTKILKKQLLLVVLFNLGYYLIGYYWIPFTISEFGGIKFPLNTIIGLGISPFFMPQLWVLIILLAILKKYFFHSHKISAIFFILLYVILEKLTPQMFPAHLGSNWLIIAPYLSMAPYLGVGFYSLLSLCISMNIIGFFQHKVNFLKKDPALILSTTILFLMAFLFPPLSTTHLRGDNPINIRVVQANIGSMMKVSSEMGDTDAVSYIHKSYKEESVLSNSFNPDLIIWPETALPGLLSSQNIITGKESFPSVLNEITTSMNSEMMFGGYDMAASPNEFYFEDQYNSAYHVSKKAKINNLYHKRILFPFGETLPLGPLNKYIARVAPNISFFAKGTQFKNFITETGHSFMPIICYEVLLDYYINDYLNSLNKRPDFILNFTNDSWYGDTSEPHQHLFLSHWRALETGIPIIRSTNTGITSVLYSDGSESKRLIVGDKGQLDLSLNPLKTKSTLYQKWGYKILALFLIIFLLLNLAFKAFFHKVMKSQDS